MSLEKLAVDAVSPKQIREARLIIEKELFSARLRLIQAESKFRKLENTLKEIQEKCLHPKVRPMMPEMFATTICDDCGKMIS